MPARPSLATSDLPSRRLLPHWLVTLLDQAPARRSTLLRALHDAMAHGRPIADDASFVGAVLTAAAAAWQAGGQPRQVRYFVACFVTDALDGLLPAARIAEVGRAAVGIIDAAYFVLGAEAFAAPLAQVARALDARALDDGTMTTR